MNNISVYEIPRLTNQEPTRGRENLHKIMCPRIKRYLPIAQAVADGQCLKQISGISHNTVDAAIRYLKDVFEAKDRCHLIAILLRENLIK